MVALVSFLGAGMAAGNASPAAGNASAVAGNAAAVGNASPEAAVRAYFAGSDGCASRLLRAAFHPAAHLAWVAPEGVRTRAQLAWWQVTDGTRPCVPARERRFAVLDREGPLVLVECHTSYADFGFHDYLLVAETPAGWLIVDKVFERVAPRAVAGAAAPGEVAAARAILDGKIAAAHGYDPALLAATHLDDAVYSRVRAGGVAWARESVSEWAAIYAARRERGEDGRAAEWRVRNLVTAGTIGWAKLEVIAKGTRYVDYVLLVRGSVGWRIAAVAWGDPRG